MDVPNANLLPIGSINTDLPVLSTLSCSISGTVNFIDMKITCENIGPAKA